VKMAVFWDVAPYSLLETDRRYRGVYYLHRQGDECSLRSVSVSLCQTTRRNIPEDSHLYFQHLVLHTEQLGVVVDWRFPVRISVELLAILN
jgi:hypothetical protein